MLVIPMAVRRMIDLGFGAHDGMFIDQILRHAGRHRPGAGGRQRGALLLVNWLGERVVADLRSDVFRHVADLGPAFYERTHSGEVMSRLTADTTQIKAAAGTALSQALRNFIMLLGALAMMFVTSPRLSLLVLLAIPLIVVPLVAFGRWVRRLSRRAQDTLAQASAYAAENLAAVAHHAGVRAREGRLGAVPPRGRTRFRCRQGTHACARRAHRDGDVSGRRQHHRRSLVRRRRRHRAAA